jgi:hypothetical protein
MAQRIHPAVAPALLGVCLFALPLAAPAAPSWQLDVFGAVHTAVANGQYPRDLRVDADASFTPPILEPLQLANFSAGASLASHGTITYDPSTGRSPSPQAAGGALSAFASVGGLRAAGSANNSVSDYNGPAQLVSGSAAASILWIDTLTFHTHNPLGADFRVSLSFADSLSTSLMPSLIGANGVPEFPGQTSAHAEADTTLLMSDAGGPSFVALDANLHLQDSATEDADQRDPVTGQPQLTLAPPSGRTLTTIVHVFDDTAILFWQSLNFDAFVANGNGLAGASADAWMNLVALDDGASYSSASGTVFSSEGNPLAPVPEPSELALVGTGLGVLGFVARRRRPRTLLELAVVEVGLARVDA